MADDSNDGEKDRNARTVPDLRPKGAPSDTVPDMVGQYVPPRPLPEASQHRTLDLRSVRLSEQTDPRRAPTELRLASPARTQGSSSRWWLVGGLALLLGVGAWLLFRTEPSKEVQAPEPATPAATASPVAAVPTRVASIEVVPVPAPVASTGAEPTTTEPAARPDRAATRTEAPAAASVAPIAPPAREPEKKRRDPWLE